MGGSWTVEISMQGVQVQMVARARYHLGSQFIVMTKRTEDKG
jgi:hypothetical protein